MALSDTDTSGTLSRLRASCERRMWDTLGLLFVFFGPRTRNRSSPYITTDQASIR